METINALKYVMGIYGLTFLVTLFVVGAIIGIRWASSGHIELSTVSIRQYAKRNGVEPHGLKTRGFLRRRVNGATLTIEGKLANL
jgi:hypothetical protein